MLIIPCHCKSICFFTGYELKEAALKEVASVSDILNDSDDFLTAKYQTYMPRVEDIKNDEWVDAYLYLE